MRLCTFKWQLRNHLNPVEFLNKNISYLFIFIELLAFFSSCVGCVCAENTQWRNLKKAVNGNCLEAFLLHHRRTPLSLKLKASTSIAPLFVCPCHSYSSPQLPALFSLPFIYINVSNKTKMLLKLIIHFLACMWAYSNCAITRWTEWIFEKLIKIFLCQFVTYFFKKSNKCYSVSWNFY